LAQVFLETRLSSRVFRDLDCLASISGAKIMAQNMKIGWKIKFHKR